MANPSKQKGTHAETRLAKHLTSHGLKTERVPLAGSEDKGDLLMTLPTGEQVTLEVKTGKMTNVYSRSLHTKWMRETLVEGKNSGNRSALVIVRYKRNLANAEVWIPNSTWFNHSGWTMLYLDDFIIEMGGEP